MIGTQLPLHVVEYAPAGTVAGSRLPIVMIPKVGGWAADWHHVATLLSDNRRVLVIDLPGHGASTMQTPTPWAQSPVDSAELVLSTLDALHIGRRHLVGTSLGGIVAAMASLASAEAQEATASLTLLSVSLRGPMTTGQLAKADAAMRHHFDDDWAPLPRGLDGADRFGLTDPLIAAEQDASRTAAGPWVRASERGAGLLGLRDHLARLSAPTLFLGGSRGMYVKYEETARELIRDVQVLSIPDSGAFVHQERPKETAAAVSDFIEGVESRAAVTRG
jgi:pimeloyl-ACP methyl ester carboxylesterase